MGFGEGGEGVFSIKRRKRIAVSDIFLNFAFAILVGCMGDDIVSCLFLSCTLFVPIFHRARQY